MIQKLFELALRTRIIIYVVGTIALLLCAKECKAFWPPDMVPHPMPPEMPSEPDDKMINIK
jgi:hypothetical protein